MHPSIPPPPRRRVAEPPRPRVSFERKLEDCTLTAAAPPVRLPLLRMERRSDRRRVDPRVPDDEQTGAFDDAEADPSERRSDLRLVDPSVPEDKNSGAIDVEEAGPWVLGRSGLLLFDPSLSDGKKKIGDGEDAGAELRLEWRSEDHFFDRTGLDGDADAGKLVPGRGGGHLFVHKDSHDDGRRRKVDDERGIFDEA